QIRITEKDQLDEPAGEDHGQGAEKNGLFQHLEDQAKAGCAKRLFKPDLLGADRGARGNEVDVIDDRQRDQQQADGAEQPDLREVSAGGQFEFKIRMEIDILQRLDDE